MFTPISEKYKIHQIQIHRNQSKHSMFEKKKRKEREEEKEGTKCLHQFQKNTKSIKFETDRKEEKGREDILRDINKGKEGGKRDPFHARGQVNGAAPMRRESSQPPVPVNK